VRRVKPLRALAIFFAVAFLGGALLAPWLYRLVQFLAAEWGWPSLVSVAGKPFHRYVSRSMLVLAVLGLWPLIRALGFQSWREVGLTRPRGHWREVGAGVALGFGTLAIAALAAWIAGARGWNDALTGALLVKHLRNAISAAVVVSVLEELLFRGTLLGGFRKSLSPACALGLSSFIYALLHFFQRPPPPEVIAWHTGLTTLGQMLRGFVDFQQLVPGLFNLTLAGLMLGWAYSRTGTLWLSIGLHAGWIFWLKSYGAFTVAVPGANEWFWGTRKLIDGWFALLVLAAAAVWLRWRLPPEREPTLRL